MRKKPSHCRDAGWTLLDLLLIILLGTVPAILLVGTGPEPWREVVFCILAPIFGFGLYFIIFWRLLPFWLRRRMPRSAPPPDHPHNNH
jgi:hypothetical protein